MIEDIKKEHSSSACIKLAYNMMCNNFATICRNTWLPNLVYALCISTAVTILSATGTAEGTSHTTAIAVSCVIATCAYVLAGGWFDATYVALVTESGTKSCVRRCISLRGVSAIAIYASLLLAAATFIIAAQLIDVKTPPATAVTYCTVAAVAVLAIATIAQVPFFYTFTRHAVNGSDTLRHTLGPNYIAAVRHIGRIIAPLALSALIEIIIIALAMSPLAVLGAARLNNAACMALGDADSLPAHFTVLTFAATALFVFIYGFSRIWMFFVSCYAYGNIEAKMTHGKDKAAVSD